MIMGLMIFKSGRLSFSIKMRRRPPDHLNRSHAMRDRHNGVAIHALQSRPLPPFPLHSLSRIDQNSVQIEQNGSACKFSHSIYLTTEAPSHGEHQNLEMNPHICQTR